MLLTTEELQELYVVGIRRNIVSVLTAAFARLLASPDDPAGISVSSTQGYLPKGLLFKLFTQATVGDVVASLRSTKKNRLQGDASYHDLGLAFCVFHVLQAVAKQKDEQDEGWSLAPQLRYSNGGVAGDQIASTVTAARKRAPKTRERSSNVTTTSMSMGSMIQPIRGLYYTLLEEEPSVLPCEHSIEKMRSVNAGAVQCLADAIEQSKKKSQRSKNLQRLDLSPQSLLGAYQVILNAGLEYRPVDDFLESEVTV
ncbi:MAG: hypothetical protein AB8B50_03230 [Pirellulaceae bacterium]